MTRAEKAPKRTHRFSNGLGRVGERRRRMSSANEKGQGEGTLSAAAGLVADAKHDFDRLNNELIHPIASPKGPSAGPGGSAFNRLGPAWQEKPTTIVTACNQFEATRSSTKKDNTSTDDTQS